MFVCALFLTGALFFIASPAQAHDVPVGSCAYKGTGAACAEGYWECSCEENPGPNGEKRCWWKGTQAGACGNQTKNYSHVSNDTCGGHSGHAAGQCDLPPPGGGGGGGGGSCTITASPNPCSIAAGSTTCSSTISWNTSAQTDIWVRVNGGSRAGPFASVASPGSKVAPWISASPDVYTFEGVIGGNLACSRTVTATSAALSSCEKAGKPRSQETGKYFSWGGECWGPETDAAHQCGNFKTWLNQHGTTQQIWCANNPTACQTCPYVPPSTAPSGCRQLSFRGGNLTPSSTAFGGSYNMSCDYGADVDCVQATSPSGRCAASGSAGTAKNFSCTAGSTEGAFSGSCRAIAGTPSNCCARTDTVGTLTVCPAGQFAWGSQCWGGGECSAFQQYLKTRGVNFDTWCSANSGKCQTLQCTVPPPPEPPGIQPPSPVSSGCGRGATVSRGGGMTVDLWMRSGSCAVETGTPFRLRWETTGSPEKCWAEGAKGSGNEFGGILWEGSRNTQSGDVAVAVKTVGPHDFKIACQKGAAVIRDKVRVNAVAGSSPPTAQPPSSSPPAPQQPPAPTASRWLNFWAVDGKHYVRTYTGSRTSSITATTGQPFTLLWETSGTASDAQKPAYCTAGRSWSGPKSRVRGNAHLLRNTAGNYIFTLECSWTAPAKTIKKTVTVKVAKAPDVLASVASSSNTCGGRYSLGGNPLGKNFGDPNCDFSKTKLISLMRDLDPINANYWVEQVVYCETGGTYNPNSWTSPEWACSHGNCGDGAGIWGLFQMDCHLLRSCSPNSQYDVNDVNWGRQASNAVREKHRLDNPKVNGNGWRYWECAKSRW